jgi:citrate synthase
MVSFKAVANKMTNIQEEHSLDIQDTLLAFVSISAITAAELFAQSQGVILPSPRDDLNLVPNFLWQTMQGKIPDRDIEQFQNCLILHMDDPDNPSLTALSQVLQQGGTISEALVAALEKHVDILHHGAGTEAMKMFIEARNAESKSEFLQQHILKGNKIFGLGHRIYTGLDPRAAVLKEMLEERALKSENEWLIEITDEVETLGSKLLLDTKGIEVYPNVDFYNAATYSTFGFPYEFNTTLFALARVAGWSAHILEIKKK